MYKRMSLLINLLAILWDHTVILFCQKSPMKDHLMKTITFVDDCRREGQHTFDNPFTSNCELEITTF